ncbi:hypothetical protein NCS57_00035900 [Fusarium keratoplasticum]|uniref:Uncharacterized protein n=1 Tax=Fusarium keratoplasticum TaxID=1328300 RepID=A0ACC0RC61_9HYPO|nr:hypothetical protein NCS57_00035900 [Fusarium keratoplasticum]KAI8683711.1 hypothetical protein NCS57_00035900 [Fusarium keratoplasticum]KAI8687827.1 hypothetical protein NCS55_00035000 [Fusarium keratoplasticum]KAI8690467.1 hypothetical protein NCS56_00037500 [Fusarium sp. Ph1]
MRSPTSLLVLLWALVSIALAADSVHLSGTSQLATHGVASQLPPHERLVHAQDRSRQVALTQKLAPGAFKASILEAASVNVKSFAHGGMSLLLDLASSSNDVLDFIGNNTNSVFSRSEPSEEGNAASGRKHVAYTSIALVLVMLFFAVWM